MSRGDKKKKTSKNKRKKLAEKSRAERVRSVTGCARKKNSFQMYRQKVKRARKAGRNGTIPRERLARSTRHVNKL